MRHIMFPEPTTPQWQDWRGRCEEAKAKLIALVQGGNDRAIEKALYKEQKVNVLMDYDGVFRGKCAYCDRDIHNQHGDVEHYRPACAVTDIDRKPVTRTIDGQVETHPGYYWLAYDWTNPVPSCIRCNQSSTRFTEDRPIGKWDRFPVVNFRAWEPGKEDDEEPLLIHPVKMKPSDHLVFHRNGVIGWKTGCGKTTVDVLGLNLYSLPDRRKERYELVRSHADCFLNAHLYHGGSVETTATFETLARIKQGYGDFTVYALMAIKDAVKAKQDEVNATQDAIDQLGTSANGV